MKKRTRNLFFLFFVVAFVLGIIIVVIKKKNETFNNFEVLQITELNSRMENRILPYKSGILKMSNDGAETMSGNGKVLWNVSYNMKDPIGSVSGNYAALGDRGGTSLSLVDGSGTVNQWNVLYEIEQIEVASQGVTAVLTSNDSHNDIFIYGPESTGSDDYLFHFNTNANEHGFPVDLALSQDGKRMVTSYLTVASDSVISWVTFYNLSEYGRNLVNHVAGAFSFEKTVVPEITFLSEEKVLVYTDHSFMIYQMKEVPEVQIIQEIDGEIEKVFYNDEYLGFVINSRAGDGMKQLLLYTYGGKKVVEKALGQCSEQVVMTEKSIIFYDNSSCEVYGLDGKILFTQTFTTNVRSMLKAPQDNTLLRVSDTALESIRLTETKEE